MSEPQTRNEIGSRKRPHESRRIGDRAGRNLIQSELSGKQSWSGKRQVKKARRPIVRDHRDEPIEPASQYDPCDCNDITTGKDLFGVQLRDTLFERRARWLALL